MKEFIENNKENLKKIYDENYQQGDGLLFIDYISTMIMKDYSINVLIIKNGFDLKSEI